MNMINDLFIIIIDVNHVDAVQSIEIRELFGQFLFDQLLLFGLSFLDVAR